MKKVISRGKVLVVVGILLMVLVFSCINVAAADKRIVLSKYPAIKLGFLTANFLKFLSPTVANEEKLIDFASNNGFWWIEIRDPQAKLTLQECKQISAYAQAKKIEVIYAVNAGLLDANYWEVISRALGNANVFVGKRVIRSGANGDEFNNDPKKMYWTADEFAKLVANANKVANKAKTLGLTFLCENANEGYQGDGKTTFGWNDFFGAVNSNVGWQIDTGNFFCVSRVPYQLADARAFFTKYVGRIGYMHLKASVNNHVQAVLCDSQMPFAEFFGPCVNVGMVNMAMEIDATPVATLDELFANHLKSVAYLQKNY